MENKPCTLCRIRPATKLNSHIIPSFMIARVCSYDGSGKRDKEVMFTMSTYEDKVYTGQIPSTKLEELFDTDKLTDERIENELKFNAFCAAERAAISSIPTRGAVASLADQYLSSGVGQLMLVTARIRGGNSGGPIINSNGQVVGVAFSEPMSEGNYDEMGYGVAYPISVLGQLLDDCEVMQVNYVDHVQ